VNDEATCPVKGTVGKKADMVPFEYQGQTYYLCCPACAEAIKADPGKYLTTPEAPPAEATAPAAPTAPPAAAAPAQTEQGFYYTCPMHPEVKLDHPGSCPECGMTLVKKQK
jgi:YHS domain-containing protein